MAKVNMKSKFKRTYNTAKRFGHETLDATAIGGMAGTALGVLGGLTYVAVNLYTCLLYTSTSPRD